MQQLARSTATSGVLPEQRFQVRFVHSRTLLSLVHTSRRGRRPAPTFRYGHVFGVSLPLPLMPFRCIAFRQKIRKDALEQYSVVDEEVFKNNLKLGREIADFLRKNIVQAEHLPGKIGEDNTETYSTCTLFTCSTLSSRHAEIRMTKHTELGDNATITNPENMVEMPRRRRQKEKEVVAVE